MIDLSKLDPNEAERLAHAEGFTGVADLYARLSDAEHLNSQHEDTIEDMRQTLLQCLPFFEDWREDVKDFVYGDTRSMDFMIRLIKQSLGESPT
jgi:hypothetical protein